MARVAPTGGVTGLDRPSGSPSADEVEAVIGTPGSLISLKQLDRLDAGSVELLGRSPFAGIGYLDGAGVPTSTFVGGTEGFAIVEDPTSVVLARPEHVSGPPRGTGIGLVFLFPGVGEVLRVNGTVALSDTNRIRVHIDEVYVHCSRAIARAGLWELPASARRATSDSHLAPVVSSANRPGLLDDPAVAEVMANSPFLVLSTFGADGSGDTSPRGDAPGFVHRLDATTLAIPDRKGNQRADTFHNLTEDSRISLAALVPGSSDVAMIDGVGVMTTDRELLESMSINDTPPHAALLMRVRSARVHPVRAISDAALWTPGSRGAAERIPDMNTLASLHIAQNSRARSSPVTTVLLKVLSAVPGFMSGLTRFGLDRALAQEGYATGRSRSFGPQKRAARIISIRHESTDIVSVRLRALDRRAFDFAPGQFFTLAVRVEGRTVRRAYSASERPGKVLRLSIRKDEGGILSTHFHRDANRGGIVEVTGPSGTFTPLTDTAAELVLIGAGSGITPLYCTISAALRRPEGPRLILIYGSRSEDHIAFRKSLDRLAEKNPNRLVVRYLLTRPTPTWTGGVGRIGTDTLGAVLDKTVVGSDASFWLCGPNGMMAGARDALRSRGVAGARIHEERFARGGPFGDPQKSPVTVTVRRGATGLGDIAVRSDSTILDEGLAAGLPLKYSCTVGECGECAVRLLRGQVEMTAPNCLAPADRTANIILTCISRPTEPSGIDIDYTLARTTSVGTGFTTWTG